MVRMLDSISVSLFVDWLSWSKQKQIQITIWWWDEQACLENASVTKTWWILKEWTPSWNMCQPVYVIVPMGKKCFSTIWISSQHFYITKKVKEKTNFSHESEANINVFSSRMKWKIKDKISWNDSPMTMILRWRVKLIVLSWGPTHCAHHCTWSTFSFPSVCGRTGVWSERRRKQRQWLKFTCFCFQFLHFCLGYPQPETNGRLKYRPN